MRATLLAAALVLVVAVAAVTARASTPDHPCRASLPRGPQVPAPLIFSTTCGMFRLEANGRVGRLPRHWLARRGSGTGRRFGAHLRLRATRDGRITLLLRKKALWRSTGAHRNGVTSVAFGPSRFTFSVYRRGVYLTDLRTSERLVVRGRDAYPLDFTRSGRLIVVSGRKIIIVSRAGGVARAFTFESNRGVALDQHSDRLYFVTPRNALVTVDGTRAHRLASVASINGSFALAEPNLLTWADEHGITVTTRRAKIVASAHWRSGLGSADLGVATSSDRALFAFRVSNVAPGKRNAGSRVYVLRRGEHEPHEIFRHRYVQAGCGALGSLGWHGHDLLYDSGQGSPVIFDVDATTTPLVLRRFARRLPHQGANDLPSAAWASDYAR
jgi:hypothetical protein